MKLPHLAPIRFAQTIVCVEKKSAKVQCTFPYKPTLAMLFEAAAQSSAAFSQEELKIGFVVSCRELELLIQPDSLEVMVHIEKKVELSNICEFTFEVLNMKEEELYAKGIITIIIEK